MKEKILLFIPGYNCEKQIIRVLENIDCLALKYLDEIIFVNNRSKDKTEEMVLNYIKKNPNIKLKVLRNSMNYNLGGSHKVAFNYAIENNFDYIIVLHGDDQGNIHDILPYLKNKDYTKYDCLLGSRFLKDSKLIGYSKFRILGNKIFNIIYSLCIGQKVKDLGSGLNMYNVKILKNKFYNGFPDELTFNYFMLMAADYYKHSIKYFPITWREEDQISNVKIIKQSIDTFMFALKYKFNKECIKDDFRNNKIVNYESKEIKC